MFFPSVSSHLNPDLAGRSRLRKWSGVPPPNQWPAGIRGEEPPHSDVGGEAPHDEIIGQELPTNVRPFEGKDGHFPDRPTPEEPTSLSPNLAWSSQIRICGR
jgi:hypothetical protein